MFVFPGIPRGLVLREFVAGVLDRGETLFLKYALNLFVKMPV